MTMTSDLLVHYPFSRIAHAIANAFVEYTPPFAVRVWLRWLTCGLWRHCGGDSEAHRGQEMDKRALCICIALLAGGRDERNER